MSIDHSEKFRAQAIDQIPTRGVGTALRHWLEIQKLRWQIRRERRVLANLPDTLLCDMGIDREEAVRESKKSLRDIPAERIYWQLGKYWWVDLD